MTERSHLFRYPELLQSKIETYTATSPRIRGILSNPPEYTIHCAAYLPKIMGQSRFPTIIASSGLWCNRNHWAILDIANALLPHGIATVTFDFAGLGDPSIGGLSDGTSDAYSIGQMRQDVRRVIDRTREFLWVDAKKMYGIGVSIGGYAQMWERHIPDPPPLKKIILLSPAPRITDWTNYFYPKIVLATGFGPLQRTSPKPPKKIIMNIFNESRQDGYTELNTALLSPRKQDVVIISAEKDEQVDTPDLWLSLTGKLRFDYGNQPLVKELIVRMGIATLLQPTNIIYVVKGADHDFTQHRKTVHDILLQELQS